MNGPLDLGVQGTAVTARESGQAITAWHADPERDRREYEERAARRQRQGTARPADARTQKHDERRTRHRPQRLLPVPTHAPAWPSPPGSRPTPPTRIVNRLRKSAPTPPQPQVPEASRHQEGTGMPNVATPNHPLAGTEQQYLPAGKVPSPDANTAPSDHKTVARLGDTVTVLDVYENWNGVSGLTVAYVYVHATGYHTHLSAGEMGITEPCGPDALPAGHRAASSPTSTNQAAERAKAPAARTPAPQLAGSSFPVPVQTGSSAVPPGPDLRRAQQNPSDQAEGRRRSR